jgi:small subunit ribosomal protein S19
MSRSSKKGPYVDQKLYQKVLAQKGTGRKEPIKTWARASQIPPEFVSHTFLVHNGKIFKEVFVNEAMVGHRLGEFSPTRTFHGHGRMVKRILSKT